MMPNTHISYISIAQAIDEAVAKLRNEESFEDCLQWINGDEEKLNEWAWETDSFFNEDYAFITSEDELFVTEENILDYYEIDELGLTADADILDFISNRMESFDDAPAAHYAYRDECVTTARCEIWGQSGPHFSHFNIFKSKEEYFKSLVDQGFMLYSGPRQILTHSQQDIIKMFKTNVTDRYFR